MADWDWGSMGVEQPSKHIPSENHGSAPRFYSASQINAIRGKLHDKRIAAGQASTFVRYRSGSKRRAQSANGS